MPAMINTSVSFAKWPTEEGPFTTQAQLEQCAEELFTNDIKFASNVIRGWDEQGNEIRILQIHGTESTPMVTAELSKGVMVILFNGTPEAITPEQFDARFA